MPHSLVYDIFIPGVSVLTFYLVTVFEQSGSSVDKLQASLIVTSWRLVMACCSSFVLMKVRRRPLFLSAALVVCVAKFSLGIFTYFNQFEEYSFIIDNIRWVPLICILSIYGGTQLGFAPILKVLYIFEKAL